MKKTVIAIALIAGLVTTYSCKENKKQEEQTEQGSNSEPAAESTTSAEPKSYEVTTSPDSVFLGKDKEAFIRIKDLKAIELSNPDGQNTGIELTYKVELTNKNAIGGNQIGIATTDFRLELDNGSKIAPSSVYVSAAPEATTLSGEDKFVIPAGAKPVALNLFYDQTRTSVKLQLK
ncbi:hypothetical protein C3K47_15400 [Solitalea longa]|uniref:DUF4352 domain-containing protein n=1 Tax=Solitalea longa TaxID=2079460 RepID=A0A2S4ZYL7_9SPHI|nr:hypothetical protein [Solitalea longa]POY35444.1 hypothetical protein C3K47_15400 [Solitalea longa]